MKNKSDIRVLVIGDEFVGKSSLVRTLIDGSVKLDSAPTTFETCRTYMELDGIGRSLTLWDTSGNELYDGLRIPCYLMADVIVLCYSISYRTSFDNVLNKWIPEIRRWAGHVPIILLGTKSDVRCSSKSSWKPRCGSIEELFVSRTEGRALSREIDALEFFECSALNSESVQNVFRDIIKVLVANSNQEHLANKRATFLKNVLARCKVKSKNGCLKISNSQFYTSLCEPECS